jgi:purine-binding chemotaxis protein CheW
MTVAHKAVEEVKQQYLSFMLAGEQYGVDVVRVQELKGWDSVTRVPSTPPYVLGVINLRGAIVPVIDLRIRLHLEQAPYGPATVIVVVRVPGTRGERTVGLVVDAMNSVHDIAPSSIRPPPSLPGRDDDRFLEGIMVEGGKLMLLLDVAALVTASIEDG